MQLVGSEGGAGLCFIEINFMGGCWMDVGWLEKAEIKSTQPSWSWSWAELANKDSLDENNFKVKLCCLKILKHFQRQPISYESERIHK